MKRYFALIFASLALQLSAQDLYIPRDVKLAISRGFRSPDGMPGKNYFQNKGRYDIHITANPPDRTIRGTEEITYVNNSPIPLASLTYKLILNGHSPGSVRYIPASPDYLTPGVQVDRYEENHVSKQWINVPTETWKRIPLASPLKPGDSIHLRIDWHFDISRESNREGSIDSTTFFLAYFYPRIAVFDDYIGWDRTFFTEVHEFYNDFNDYTISVTVPHNYFVWSTGDLVNADEVLSPTALSRLNKSFKTDSIIHIASEEDLRSNSVTNAKTGSLTWRWKANDITDVAIALSDHYLWDASSVIVDQSTGRRSSVQAGYSEKAPDFREMVEYGRHSLDWYSRHWPGVPYPFNKSSIILGFADMEYPMMVNDSHQDDPAATRFIAEHEIAHTWFPFYMGINEARYGFMDEGWATTLEYLIGIDDLGKEKADELFKRYRVEPWIKDPSADEEIPIITPGTAMTGAGFGNNEYGKAALGYLAAKDLLGDDAFRKGLTEFMRRWHGKHPLPWDMFASINAGAGQNIDWFWNRWFFTNYHINLSIYSVETTSKGSTIVLKNIGGFPAPTDVRVTFDDNTNESFHQSPAIWRNDMRQTTLKIPVRKKIKTVKLDGGIFIDADESDNSWPLK